MLKHTLFVVFLAVLTTVGLLAVKDINTESANERRINPTRTPETRIRQIVIEGTVDCLNPKKSTGAMTLECIIGLYTDSGDAYSLDTIQLSDYDISQRTGDRIRVKGTFTPVSALSTNFWQKYDIEGIVTLSEDPEVL